MSQDGIQTCFLSEELHSRRQFSPTGRPLLSKVRWVVRTKGWDLAYTYEHFVWWIPTYAKWRELRCVSHTYEHFCSYESLVNTAPVFGDQNFTSIANRWPGFLLLTLSLLRVINVKIPLQPHKNMTSHSMENLTFHSLLRSKIILLQILATSLIQLLFERLGEYTFWAQEWKG